MDLRRFLPLFLVSTGLLLSSARMRNEQRWINISFRGVAGDQTLVQGKTWFSAVQGDSVSVNVFRFYISGFTVESNGKDLGHVDYHLVDLFDTSTTQLKFAISDGPITGYRFNLGIDSTTNVNGAGSGVLDPTRGMYWAWQSGYINLKLEGKSAACTKSQGEFQFHLGGYLGTNYCMQKVQLRADESGNTIQVDVAKFFTALDFASTYRIMSPSPKAVELSKKATQMFTVK